MNILLANPLRGGLGHYERQLVSLLVESGVHVRATGVLEPSTSGASAARWLAHYVRVLGAQRAVNHDRLLACWPAVGYLDVAMLRLVSRVPVSLIVHDPSPLVHARGYGEVARQVAHLSGGRTELIVHSEIAETEVRNQTAGIKLTRLPLPMLGPASKSEPKSHPVRVSVVGQFKPDRDVAGLVALAQQAPAEWELKILGRG